VGAKSTPEMSRVPYAELESAYINRPNIFNGINKIVQTIMSADCNIEGKNKVYVDYLNNFVNQIGTIGGQLTWEELRDKLIRYEGIYGNVWVELIYNKNDTLIVDLDFIDPKKMDYAKDSKQNIILDPYGNPIGYVETLPMNADTSQLRKIPAPPNVRMQPNMLYIPVSRVAHFKLYTVGDGFYGIGLVEPAYKSIVRGMNMEQALANWTYNSGFPARVVYVGDERNPPNSQKVDDALKAIKQLNYKQNLSMPYYNKVELIEAKRTEKMVDNLDYFQNAEVTALGIPRPFVTGGGEETNRATLSNQDSMFRLTLRDLMTQFGAAVRKLIFRPIILNEYPDAEEVDIPYLVFGEIPRIETKGNVAQPTEPNKREALPQIQASTAGEKKVNPDVKKF
jgi:hypothetical protein